MKRIIVCLFSTSILLNSATFSQDYSTFFLPTGFRLPPMRAGQYVLTLAPTYHKDRMRSTSDGIQIIGGFPILIFSQSDYPTSRYKIGSSGYYGLSDETTLFAEIEFVPKQKMGTSTSSSGGTSTSIDRHDQSYSTSIAVSHRARSNLEFSLALSYQDAKPISGYTSSTLKSYDVTLAIVLLGN